MRGYDYGVIRLSGEGENDVKHWRQHHRDGHFLRKSEKLLNLHFATTNALSTIGQGKSIFAN
jgi:hypothetical protein